MLQVNATGLGTASGQKWVKEATHYRELTRAVVAQTERRVMDGEKVLASEKIVSLFEPHSDIIIKGYRDVQYGHKINLSTEKRGLITCLSIEKGNPSDSERFLPMLDAHQKVLNKLPGSVVCDGGYASKENVKRGRALGIQQVVFHKRVGISYLAMGVKKKTFERLRNFRAGIEGNISELKRAFGADFWCRLLVQTFGADFWCRLLVQTFGADFWCRLLVQTFGADFWCRLLVQTFGADFWCRLLVQTFGADFWCRLLVQTRQPGKGTMVSRLMSGHLSSAITWFEWRECSLARPRWDP